MLLKSIGKMDIKVMFGLDVLILLCDKNFFVFFFCLFLFVMLLVFYYIFVNGYLIEVGMKNVIGWMMFGQFFEIFFMLVLLFFIKCFGIKKVLLFGLVIVVICYGFFIYGSVDEYFIYVLLFFGILFYGVSYDFYYVIVYIYVDKKVFVYMCIVVQGLIMFCCQGFGSLFGYCFGGVMMEKMFVYQELVNGLIFNWFGMWIFGVVMIVIIVVLFMIFFCEFDNEIMVIKVDDCDIVLI